MSPDETAAFATARAVPRPAPVIRPIAWSDVVAALRAGLEDFRAAPALGAFFGGFYALGGLAVVACLAWLGLVYLAYPLAAGYALVGPFAAAGLYEVSRRRETGTAPTWRGVLGAIRREGGGELAWMAFVGIFILIVWIYQVRLLLALFLGFNLPPTLSGFVTQVLTTPEGLMFLALGHVVGAGLSLLTFCLTVVACPLLLDRDHDFITAMIASVRAVIRNPLPMLGYAFTVAALLVVGMLPAFLGLVVVLPILGHATWHLYRRVIAPLRGGPA
jgi:uncharacterized membrane protein